MGNNLKNQKAELRAALLKSKSAFFFIGIFSMFINILALTAPLYMLQLYDRVVTSRSEDTLLMLTLLVVVLFFTSGILSIVRSRILVRIGNKMDSLLSFRVFDSTFELANKDPGKATAAPLNDLTKIRQFLTGNGAFAFFDAPWMPIYIFVLYMFHPMFGYFAIFAGTVLFSVALINQSSSKKYLAEASNFSSKSSMYVSSNIRNSEVIHAMGMGENIKKIWHKNYLSFLFAQTRASDKAGFWSNMSTTLRTLFQSLMLGLGGYLAITGEVTPGMMIAGSIIMGRALAPLDLMINSWKQFVDAKESYGKVDGLLKAFPEREKSMQLPDPQGVVQLEQIYVIPPKAELPSIKALSMVINKGDVVGVIGPSAAGKSSLARAILGLWPLKAGKVRLDGADISQWDREHLGKFVGYLPQDIELFTGTVSENISRFNEVDPKKVVEAAQLAGVHELILKLPKGYDTVIGIGGSSLSGGQRQRIGLARALYDNPVLVVLDEPNSNLDDIGEKALLQAIIHLRKRGTTVVLITHKPSILQVTTKVALMQDGTLKLYGPTADVLARMSGKTPQNPPQQANPKATQPVKEQSVSLELNKTAVTTSKAGDSNE